MVAIESLLIAGFLVFFMSILLMIAFYHIFLFANEGGFTNSISVRLLIAGSCFNIIFIGIIGYLVLQVRLLMRLIERMNDKIAEKEAGIKEKVFQTLRGRSSSRGTSRISTKSD